MLPDSRARSWSASMLNPDQLRRLSEGARCSQQSRSENATSSLLGVGPFGSGSPCRRGLAPCGSCEFGRHSESNGERERARSLRPARFANETSIQFLPLSTGAACLDGSPYAFYYVPSKSGSTKWSIYLNGGGWCYDERDCAQRAKTRLGSSTLFDPTESCGCGNVNDEGTGLEADCNCLNLPCVSG